METSSAEGSRLTMPSGICESLRERKWGRVAIRFGHRTADQIEALGPILDADHVANPHLVAGDVDAVAVDGNVAVTNTPGLAAALAETEPMNDVIKPTLEPASSVAPVFPLLFEAWWKYLRNCRSKTP